MKKLVIFDLDGTLLNTIADLAQSTNHALAALGYPTHEEQEYNFWLEMVSTNFLSVLCPKEKRRKKMSCAYEKNLYPIMTNIMQTKAAPTPASRNF